MLLGDLAGPVVGTQAGQPFDKFPPKIVAQACSLPASLLYRVAPGTSEEACLMPSQRADAVRCGWRCSWV